MTASTEPMDHSTEVRMLELRTEVDLLKLKLFELDTRIAAAEYTHKRDVEELTGKWRELSLAVATMERSVATLASDQRDIKRALGTLSRQLKTSHLSSVHVLAALVTDLKGEPSADLRKALVFAEQVFDPIGPDPEVPP